MSLPSGDDRLSFLPDELLHHILSFLPDYHEIARTSVLSPRFRQIWAHHPSIRLRPDEDSEDCSAYSDEEISRYLRHVECCLSLHNLPLLLSLDLLLFSSGSAHSWLHRVSTRSPSLSSLSLSAVSSDEDVALTSALFTFTNVVSLDLSFLSFPSVPSDFRGFLSLVTLKLDCCRIDDKTLTSFPSKCPSLRSLSLSSCNNLTSIYLFSAKLDTLYIWACKNLSKVTIDAPNLTSLTSRGKMINFYMNNAPKLVDVDILIFLHAGMDISTFDEWKRLIVGISHARNSLCVSSWFFKFQLPRAITKPLFRNLRKLHIKVHWITFCLLDKLASVLGHCLSLEELDIKISGGNREYALKKYNWTDESERKKWLINFDHVAEEGVMNKLWDAAKHLEEDGDVLHNLKAITVIYFVGTQNEMKMLEYLFGKAINLEKVYIEDCMSRSIEEVDQLLSCVPRASSHVQICELKWD